METDLELNKHIEDDKPSEACEITEMARLLKFDETNKTVERDEASKGPSRDQIISMEVQFRLNTEGPSLEAAKLYRQSRLKQEAKRD